MIAEQNRINVKDLIFVDPVNKLNQRFEGLVSHEDWERAEPLFLKNKDLQCLDGAHLDHYPSYLVNVMELFPREIKGFINENGIEDKVWSTVMARSSQRTTHVTGKLKTEYMPTSLAANAVQIISNKDRKKTIRMMAREAKILEKLHANSINTRDEAPHDLLHNLEKVAVIFPESLKEERESLVRDSDVENIRKYFEQEKRALFSNERHPSYFPEIAMRAKIALGENFLAIDGIFDDNTWDFMREETEERRDNEYFYGMAYALKVLSADEVRIDENGIRLIVRNEKALKSTYTKLPDVKKF